MGGGYVAISPAAGPGAGSQHSQPGRRGAWPWLAACLVVAVGASACAWLLQPADSQPTDAGISRAVLLSEIARMAELLKGANITGVAAEPLFEYRGDPLPPLTTAPRPTASSVGWVRPRVVYGHVHMAKTGGTSQNGNLSLHFERVCGHKGYSYDAFQTNERLRKRARYVDSVGLVRKLFSRARVPVDIMQEIGFEDCDWISYEATWPIWRQLQGLKMPLELHVPCREPIDHLMSQCNHQGIEFSCAGSPEAAADKCLLFPDRFSKQLQALKNTKVKCFDWRAAHDGRYFDFISQRLQRRRTEGKYVYRASNKKRVKKSECVWKDPAVRQRVRAHLLKLDYYSFCDACMGSSDDLFQANNGGNED